MSRKLSNVIVAALLLAQNAASAFTVNAIQNASAIPSSEVVTVAAMGDVLIHKPLYEMAVQKREGFYSIFQPMTPYVSLADVAYANFEGASAMGIDQNGRDQGDIGFVYDGNIWTGTDFRFNYHPRLFSDLARAGFDVVSLANNHTWDKRAIGVDRTVDAVRASPLMGTGIKKVSEPIDQYAVVTVTKGIRIGWVSCTDLMNSGKNDRAGRVLFCGDSDLRQVMSDLKSRRGAELVIVTPHWGEEYQQKASKAQKARAQTLVSWGADAIIGAHPHVLQPWENIARADGRQSFVMYSLGNFVAFQKFVPRKTTMVLYLSIVRDERGQAVIEKVNYIPTVRDGYQVVPILGNESRYSENMQLLKSMYGLDSIGVPKR